MPILSSGVETINPTTNGLNLIKRAYRLIGILAAGEQLQPEDLDDGIEALNDMLDSWNNEGLLVYTLERQPLTLTASDGSYSIGPSGDFVTERPARIDHAGLILAGDTTESPLSILTRAQYAATRDKTTVSTPASIYIDGEVPNRNISLIALPTNADTLVIYSWKSLRMVTASSVNETISFPPGYPEAIKFNLALKLAGENGVEPSVYVLETANSSLASIRRMNTEPIEMRCDPAIVNGHPQFDILSGDF
jgi:hypothetical protein